MKRKRFCKLALFGIVLALGLQGCGSAGVKSNNTNDTVSKVGERNKLDNDDGLGESQEDDLENVRDATLSGEENLSDFYAGADLQGSVVSFSDEGFVMSPAINHDTGDGGVEMIEAAPGSEDDKNNVNISYADDLKVEIVTISKSSLAEVSREETTTNMIKKQTEVCVFGKCQDTLHWTANKILILRWQ